MLAREEDRWRDAEGRVKRAQGVATAGFVVPIDTEWLRTMGEAWYLSWGYLEVH